MVVERRLLPFVDAVKKDLEKAGKAHRDKLEVVVAESQAKYDENLALAQRLGIKKQLEEAARNIREATRRIASVKTSDRPKVVLYGLIDSYSPSIIGNETLSLTLKWEPSNTRGVDHSIQVVINNGIVEIVSRAGKKSFKEDELLNEELQTVLFGAYKHPLDSSIHG